MARTRSWSWTVIISLLVGLAIATAFWRYSPYGHDQLAQQVREDLKSQQFPPGMKAGDVNLKKLAPQVAGANFQMVSDGKQVFVLDLKSGRIWRYFRQTKEEGFSREDEGFLPIPFYYAGKKHYAAGAIEAPATDPENPAAPAQEGKQPQ